MEILQKRVKRGKMSTLSILYVDGVQRGYVVEDKDRDLHSTMSLAEIKKIKVYAETAIPTGRYKLISHYSDNMRRWVAWFQDVPGYSMVYMHPGNWIKDTKGCVLPGLSWGFESGEYCVRNSGKLFVPLLNEIQAEINRGGEVWYSIEQHYEDGAGRLLV